MKKLVTISIILLLFFTTFLTNISAFEQKSEKNSQELLITQDKQLFSKAEIITNEFYSSIKIDGVDKYISISWKPKLPVYTKTFVFPLGTKIIDIQCTEEDVTEIYLSKKIEPVPEPIPKTKITKVKIDTDYQSSQIEDTEIYSKDSFYPNDWSDCTIKVGMKDGKRNVLVFVDLYPVLYNPKENIIRQAGDINIEITYEEPTEFSTTADEYDMVIIAPKKFHLPLLRLINHKNNNMGVKTKFMDVESIYREAEKGTYDIEGENKPFDKQEMIKYFIKYAIENWNITYVLLVGGKIGQLPSWHLPVRYAQMEDKNKAWWDIEHITDLYYADIYKYSEQSQKYVFDDWDTNENNEFGEWENYYDDPIDTPDLVPDVYLGRIACRNKIEVSRVVKKIVNYEKTPHDDSWFKNMVIVGGDTAPNGYDYYEGEESTAEAAEYMEQIDFEITELWASTGNFTSDSDIIREINNGCGFIFLDGHGTPIGWDTHPPNNKSWIDDFFTFEMNALRNRNKYPVCLVCACHSSQYDIGIDKFISGILEEGADYFGDWSPSEPRFGKGEWYPNCWSWNLLRQKNAGSIATIGNTGLGYLGYEYSFIHFFEIYKDLVENQDNGKITLGRVYSDTITDTIPYGDEDDFYHIKCIEIWALLGDPSLDISLN